MGNKAREGTYGEDLRVVTRAEAQALVAAWASGSAAIKPVVEAMVETAEAELLPSAPKAVAPPLDVIALMTSESIRPKVEALQSALLDVMAARAMYVEALKKYKDKASDLQDTMLSDMVALGIVAK
jgi:hypothetical protein